MSKSPAFQFYAADFLADSNQAVMSAAEAGIYIRLLCRCWLEGHIPDDVKKLASLAGVAIDEMRECWSAVRVCFQPDPAFKGFLIHPRLDAERVKQVEFREKRKEAGRKGAASKHGKHVAEPLTPPPSSSTSVLSSTAVGFSSSSAHSGEEKRALPSLEDLVAYVGDEHRYAVEACARLRGLSVSWAMMLLGAYGPGSKTDPAIDRIPEGERAAVLGLALTRYATDAKDWSSRFFRSFVTRAWADRQKGEAEDAEIQRTTARAAAFVPVMEERRKAAPPLDGEVKDMVQQLVSKTPPGGFRA